MSLVAIEFTSLLKHEVFVFFSCRLIHKSYMTEIKMKGINHKVAIVDAKQHIMYL
jgi:hypothetical protein